MSSANLPYPAESGDFEELAGIHSDRDVQRRAKQAFGVLAEDTFQETCHAVVRAHQRRGIDNLGGYFCRIARGSTACWLTRLIEAVGDRLFATDDRAAVQHGWQITKRGRGLGRWYRDPQFDTLHACPRCDGNGETGHEPCSRCGGTGRVTRSVLCPRGQVP